MVVQEVEGPASRGAHAYMDEIDLANRGSLSEAPRLNNNGRNPIHLLLNGLLCIKLKVQER